MALFDRYLIVDWSASDVPARGRNSIWLALAEAVDGGCRLVWTRNIATRHAAITMVEEVITESRAAGKRLFAGFDFAFGYPSGAAAKMAGKADWRSLWAKLESLIEDSADNRSNRFEVAADLNRSHLDGALFWGHPQGRLYDGLTEKMPVTEHPQIARRRLVEGRVKSAKSVWQLAYAGSVGSQSLLGIPALERLKRVAGEPVKIWPFETRFDVDLSAPCVIAEVYPSLFPVTPRDGQVLDAAQVETLALGFATLDAVDRFQPLLSKPDDLDGAALAAVLSEEGWIVGAGHQQALSSTAARPGYIRDPAAIYQKSFETIRSEADLSRFSEGMEALSIRLIHACGMVDLADDIAFSDGAFDAGAAALQAGAPVFCDAEMVRHGIIRHLLPADNDILCLLNDERVRPLALELGTTRSAAQVDLWADRLEGSIIAIGNAPTALFRLLELLDRGAAKPALILGMPVGFVGAAESKDALITDSCSVPYIAVRGRRGGSAMASAAVNALAGGLGANV